MSRSEDAISLLEGLVSIPSLSGEEGDAARWLVDWMAQRGFRARVDEAGNAVGEAGKGPREVLLLGHIDTVPGEIPVRRDGELLHGRGTVDAKGPLCAFAAAAARMNPPDGWRVTVIGAVEEEAASSKGARHVLESRKPPRVCVIGEPSRWDRITVGYKGRVSVDVRLRAPYLHSAGNGRLPAEWGVEAWRCLEEACARFNENVGEAGEFHRLSPSLSAIRSREDGAFGRVRLSTSFRIPPALPPAELETMVREALAAALGPGEGVEAEATVLGAEPAHRASKSGPLVRALLASIREAGGDPTFVLKTGTSDMNVVGPHWPDTPIVAYGPGDSALDHTPHEHVDLREYLRSVDVLEGALRRLCPASPEDDGTAVRAPAAGETA